jgi:hypothetical protein
MSRKPKKPPIPPPFSSDSARRAQPLAVAKRRATDELLRASLADLLPAMPARLRREVVACLRIRAVERLRLAALV